MKTVLLILIVLSFTLFGCTGGGGGNIDFYDGNWSMCKYTKNGKFIANLPTPTGQLPPGAGLNIDGTEIECVPIPARPDEEKALS